MLMLVVHVVFVLMVVLLDMVGVRVVMTLGPMQPYPGDHQGTRHQQIRRNRFAKPGHDESTAPASQTR
jgi:hypothetical protein